MQPITVVREDERIEVFLVSIVEHLLICRPATQPRPLGLKHPYILSLLAHPENGLQGETKAEADEVLRFKVAEGEFARRSPIPIAHISARHTAELLACRNLLAAKLHGALQN